MRSALFLAILATACVPGGGSADDEPDAAPDAGASTDGGGVEDPGAWLAGERPDSAAWAAAFAQMVALARSPGFVKENVGDAAAYLASDATSPSREDELASLYYETEGFAAAVEGARDDREGVADLDAGGRVAADVARALTLGFGAESPAGRGSARWHGLVAARSLDYALLMLFHRNLSLRTATGYDRARSLLLDGANRPTGLGRLVADADGVCGSTHLADLRADFDAVREPFAAALEEHGELDPLDRLAIEPGVSPEYDAAIDDLTARLVSALGTAMLAKLTEEKTAAMQAEALASYGALRPSVALVSEDAAGQVGSLLDAAEASAIEVGAVRGILEDRLALDPCRPAAGE